MKNIDFKKYENILIMGCDVRSDISKVDNPTEKEKCMRSDAMVVVSLHKETGRIKMVSLERDVLVGVHGYGYIKLNSPVVYGGPKFAMKVINDNFHLNIKKYIMTGISNMIEFVDSIGGIDIELTDKEAQYIDEWMPNVRIVSKKNDEVPPLITGGMRHLNGMQAVAHARNRSIGSVYARGDRINDVIRVIVKKIKTEYTYTQIIGIGLRSLKYVRTNIGIIKGMKLLRLGMRTDLKDIPTYHAPENGTFEEKRYGLYFMEVDFEQATERLWDFLSRDQS